MVSTAFVSFISQTVGFLDSLTHSIAWEIKESSILDLKKKYTKITHILPWSERDPKRSCAPPPATPLLHRKQREKVYLWLLFIDKKMMELTRKKSDKKYTI